MHSIKTKKKTLHTRIETVLDSIRPYLVTDGGNVRVLNVTKSRDLILEFEGNCRKCPLSETTFKIGVEQAIRSAIPEINKISIT